MKKEKDLYSNLTPYLNCQDHVVSGEYYEILKNEECDVLVTLPVPVNLKSYYKSNNYISHIKKPKSFFEKIYKITQKYTLHRKLQLINKFVNKDKYILDVGSGSGDFLEVCRKNSWKAVGVEPNKKAKRIAKEKGLSVYKNIDEISAKKFDVITMWHVLEHIPNLKDYIENIKLLLKTNGTLFVAVPNFKSYDAFYYKEFWAAYDVPRHLWHFSQDAIKRLFSNFYFEVIETFPMKLDSYYVSILSEKYKNKKPNFFKGVYIGFLSNLKAKKTTEYSSIIYVLKNKL